MSAEFLLAWWNLVFIVPFLLALLYLAVYTVSGLTFGESDMEMAGDLHADVGGDLHADADVHADADAESELSGESGEVSEHDIPFMLSIMSWLGLGRVPLSILLMVLFIAWGVIGFVVNISLSHVLPAAWLAIFGSLPAAGLGSAFLTRGVVRLVGHWMPTTETYARRTSELVGVSGQAIYDISPAFGLANVRDKHGDFFQVPCRSYPDREPIGKGAKVLLVDYDSQKKFFYVTPYDVPL